MRVLNPGGGKATSNAMDRRPPILDMRTDGTFRAPPTMPLSTKLMIGGALVVVLGGSLAVAFVAIWVVSMLLPAIIVAGGVAWLAYKFRRWKGGGSATPGFGARPPSRF